MCLLLLIVCATEQKTKNARAPKVCVTDRPIILLLFLNSSSQLVAVLFAFFLAFSCVHFCRRFCYCCWLESISFFFLFVFSPLHLSVAVHAIVFGLSWRGEEEEVCISKPVQERNKTKAMKGRLLVKFCFVSPYYSGFKNT